MYILESYPKKEQKKIQVKRNLTFDSVIMLLRQLENHGDGAHKGKKSPCPPCLCGLIATTVLLSTTVSAWFFPPAAQCHKKNTYLCENLRGI
jgi:hypothetical protein